MTPSTKEELWAEIRSKGGIPYASVVMATSGGGTFHDWALEFVLMEEAKEKADEAEERRAATREAIAAAVAAAESSKRSARWTAVAAFATAIAAAGTLVQAFTPYLHERKDANTESRSTVVDVTPASSNGRAVKAAPPKLASSQ